MATRATQRTRWQLTQRRRPERPVYHIGRACLTTAISIAALIAALMLVTLL